MGYVYPTDMLTGSKRPDGSARLFRHPVFSRLADLFPAEKLLMLAVLNRALLDAESRNARARVDAQTWLHDYECRGDAGWTCAEVCGHLGLDLEDVVNARRRAQN